MNERGRDLRLAIIVGDGFPEKPAAIRGAQRFERIRVQTRAADAREDRIKKMPRQVRALPLREAVAGGAFIGFTEHRLTSIVAITGK